MKMAPLTRNCLFFSCFAVFTSLFAKFIFHLDLNKRTYNQVPGECGMIPNLPGILGLTTTTGGRLYLTVSPKGASSDTTHLFTFYSDNRTAREISIRGAPAKLNLKPGPISTTSDSDNPTVFVFNRNTENVEVFETNDQNDMWKYVKTLENSEYKGLTDLSASGPNSFYYVKNSTFGVFAVNFFERLFPIPTGQVLFTKGRKTQHVNYVSTPTGIAYDDFKNTIFITSFSRNSIIAVKVNNEKLVKEKREYDIGCSPTSIWKDFDGSFVVTCHQIRFRYLLNFLRMIPSSPSMVLRVVIPVEENREISITQLYSNDGATISTATLAVRSGRSLLISEGTEILNCNL